MIAYATVVYTMKRLVYLANIRLPTEKAHGFQICKMCEAFSECGVEVHLVHPRRRQVPAALQHKTAFDYYGIAPRFSIEPTANMDIFFIEKYLPKKTFSALFFMHAFVWAFFAVRTCRKQQADIYYTRDIPIAYWLVRHGLPTVYEAHAVSRGLQGHLVRRIARRPELQRVVALTTAIQNRLVAAGVAAHKTLVAPDSVDHALFQNLPDRQHCRERLGLPRDRRIIGYVGRFNTMGMEKGITELIEAVARLAGEGAGDMYLVCVGGPQDAIPDYLAYARTKGLSPAEVLFRDRRPNQEVPLWIRACDVVTIPWPWTEFSAYFTSPMKLFEYMAAGVPVVASDLPALRDVLQHGKNAWLVNPGDALELAKGIQHIMDSPVAAKSLSEQALRDAAKFTWQNRAEAVLGLLR